MIWWGQGSQLPASAIPLTHYVAFRTQFAHLKNKNHEIHVIITSQLILHSSFETPCDNMLQVKSSNDSDASRELGRSK